MSYNLHRSDKESDWANIPDVKRNIWQKIATRTGGVVTPANVMTDLGVWVVHKGLKDFQQGEKLKGVLEIATGHLFDAGDGFLADLTKTKSPLGEVHDAVADKVKEAFELTSLTKSGDIPPLSALVMGTHGVIMGVLTGVAQVRGVRTHSSLPGKLATGAKAAAITHYTGSAVAQESGHTTAATWLRQAGHLAVGAVLIEGVAGIINMTQEAFAVRTPENSL